MLVPRKMKTDFQIIADFLSDFSPEIEGRSAEPLTARIQSQLIKLSEGTLDAAERREISKRLLSDPRALDFLLSRLSVGS